MNLDNPLRNIQLKEWPDFVMAISGVSLVSSVVGMLSGVKLGYPCTLMFGGAFLFGLGGRIAHFKYRDASVKGNSNAWFSGWRHTTLADSFALLGVSMVLFAIYTFYTVGTQP